MQSAFQRDAAAFGGIIQDLETAWNAGDADRFAARMAEDADFVTIRAEHLHGRQEIAASHRHIFTTIYAGSRNVLTLEGARFLSADVALAHACSVLVAPSGPLKGSHDARMSLVLLRSDGVWWITSFHITLASVPKVAG